jgi:hypothetical protein
MKDVVKIAAGMALYAYLVSPVVNIFLYILIHAFSGSPSASYNTANPQMQCQHRVVYGE